MSVAGSNDGVSAFQPFQCQVCQSRFTRHENLKRHAALHSRNHEEASLPCELCQATFSRPDLRNRHMKRKHPEHEDGQTTKRQRLSQSARTRSMASAKSQAAQITSHQSPTESHHRRQSGRSEDDGGLGLENEDWHPTPDYDQHQLDYSRPAHQVGSANLSTSAPTSLEGDESSVLVDSLGLSRPTSLGESTYSGHIVAETTSLDQSLIMNNSFFRPSRHFDNNANSVNNSQPAMFDPNMAGLNFLQGISPLSDSLLTTDLQQYQTDWFPSNAQVTRGVDRFFARVSHFLPFLHRPTFDVTQNTRHLVLGMLCLGYQHCEDPDCGDQPGTGSSLAIHCFHRARAMLASDDDTSDDSEHNISLVQTYLLLQICAIMYLCGKESKYGLKMHSKMVSLARAGGLTQPVPIESTTTEDLESLWKEFLRAESHKRTLYALHQIDALWYQILSIPRCVSHLEIKHDLPCPEICWTASSAAEWAHRQLITKQSGPSVQYTDAVRRLLSHDTDLHSIPAFDPYGAINIAQFLISSAREASGWSTMTGMLSMERFEALRSSLVTLGPFIRPQNVTRRSKNASLCEATWETAMIELQMWSPSHTGGIVASSMDAMLFQSTYLASSCELVCEADTAKAIQTHIDWFLRYIDGMSETDSDAPWIMLYAYKTFLIAWQLVHAGVTGIMQIVGVPDGDTAGAIAWAREAFRRRERWQIGKLIVDCLNVLDK